jgi:hypothetical protein
MATKVWESIKVRYCEHAEDEVSLEAQVVYPSEWLPEQPPQVVSHRCSHAFACTLDNRPSCIWAGTQPAFDPFKESEKEK